MPRITPTLGILLAVWLLGCTAGQREFGATSTPPAAPAPPTADGSPGAPPPPAAPVLTFGRCAGSVCELREATAGPTTPEFREVWSPDFASVAWEELLPPSGTGACDERRAIHVTTGGVDAVVGVVGRNEREGTVEWSPDGSLLAIEDPSSGCGIGKPESIRVMRPDGSGGFTIAEAEVDARGAPLRTYSSPAWSPDGREIAYIEHEYPLDLLLPATRIVITRLDVGTSRVVPAGSLSITRLSWLGAGELTFLASVPPTTPQPPRDPPPPPELFAVRPDGSGLRQLTSGGAYVEPDGRRDLVVAAGGACIAYRRFDYARVAEDLSLVCLGGRAQHVTGAELEGGELRRTLYAWLTDGRLGVIGTAQCDGLLAHDPRTGHQECVRRAGG